MINVVHNLENIAEEINDTKKLLLCFNDFFEEFSNTNAKNSYELNYIALQTCERLPRYGGLVAMAIGRLNELETKVLQEADTVHNTKNKKKECEI